MDLKSNQYGSVFSDDDDELFERQAVLLNQINVLVRNTTTNTGQNTEDIYSLKQQYNHLVNKRAKIARNSLSDPMDALPPELWPDIIKDIIGEDGNSTNELLNLVSVSKSWFSLLITLPVIWTTVRLDQSEADYLAKAITCIQLSVECKIDLFIYELTAEEWREILFWIVPEGRRIRRISFELEHIDPLVARQILGDFPDLPVLRDLSLPHSINGSSNEQYFHALVIEKMPSIEMVSRMGTTMDTGLWNSFVTSCFLHGEFFQKANLEALSSLPKLRHLILLEDSQSQRNVHTPSLPESSFISLVHFHYDGPAICRCLAWIGNSLTTLTTMSHLWDEDTNALLVAVSRFPRLDKLTVNFSGHSLEPSVQNTVLPENSRNTVKSLTLSSNVLFNDNWELIFPVFFAASPSLEALVVERGVLTDSSWLHIQTIENLRDLTITTVKSGHSSAIPLDTKSLRNFRWNSDWQGLLKLFARLQSQFLQTLWITQVEYYPITVTHVDAEGDHTIPSRCILSGAAFPNLTSLTISTSDLAIWELGSLTRLRELELQATYGSYSPHWTGCIFEGILVRPQDNPALEKITLKGTFADWDILLLMLERRNFLNQHGISSIKVLVVDCDLPYRLLYPLSELLGGRFVERDSNRSFSLEALGERLWDESSAGCLRCHCTFRKCKSLVKAVVAAPGFAHAGPTRLGQEYPLPHEYLVADPPLPPDVMLWLSGRRERQDSFMRRYEESGRRAHVVDCGESLPYKKWPVRITGDILVGAHFVEE